jgi:hypothetical protein
VSDEPVTDLVDEPDAAQLAWARFWRQTYWSFVQVGFAEQQALALTAAYMLGDIARRSAA